MQPDVQADSRVQVVLICQEVDRLGRGEAFGKITRDPDKAGHLFGRVAQPIADGVLYFHTLEIDNI